MLGIIPDLSKRKRFILASILVLIVSAFFPTLYTNFGGLSIAGFIVFIYLLTWFALKENLNGVEYITLFVLPVLFSLSANLFTTILPDRRIFRLPILASIPVGMYIIFLTENIFNVAAIRTIQLLRAAHAVSYLMSLLTAFFIISFIISAHQSILFNVLVSLAAILPLTLQFLWNFDLIPKFTPRTILFSLAICLVFTQINIMVNFYPQSVAMVSLFLVAVYYVLLGLLQHFYEKKLTRKPTIEYAIVALIVFSIMIVTSTWLG
jgi:hypothetical protein